MKNGQLILSAAISAAIVGAGLPAIALAQSATLNTVEAPRVTKTIDNKVLSTLPQSHLALIAKMASTGSVAESTTMSHMQLVLKPSALREVDLSSLIAAQHDPQSPEFHHWLTPEQFGASFGVADADIAAAKSWLISQGFTVNGVYPNKQQIDFSGTAGLVNNAFHTQLNHYMINKVSHIANGTDISIPTALQEVVAGVAGLNDLHPQSMHVPPKVGQFDAATHKFKLQQGAVASTAPVSPQAVAFNSIGARGLVPYDMVTMYGVTKMRASGMTGKGITIAVVEDADMVPGDWANFVSQFSLGSYGGTFAQIQPQATGLTNCIDPGNATAAGESGETILDAEWSTAMAPGANIEVASCDDSNSTNSTFGGVYTAADNLINGTARPDIISASYGLGEGYTVLADKTAIDQMWAQADAEGISVFVSAGDSGSNPSYNGYVIAGAGIDANALATSPNDTAVGGTDTADILDGTTNTYFSKTPNSQYGTALSYVPEIPWNDSCGNQVAASVMGFVNNVAFCEESLKFDPQGYYITSEAGSGGPSSVDSKPAWQKIVYNAAQDASRDVPDVSLFGGAYGGYTWVITCTASYPCEPQFTGPVELSAGTSLSSPMFAGIQALIDQGLDADQGNAAPTLYALAAVAYGGPTGTAPASLATCNAVTTVAGTANCVFHNVTVGGNVTECIQQVSTSTITPNCDFIGSLTNYEGSDANPAAFDPAIQGSIQVGMTATATSGAYRAQPGWSFASGLGSVNATNLLAAWKAYNTAK